MLTIQAVLLISSLAILAAMVASVAWLSALRRAPEPVRVDSPADGI